MQSNLQQRLSQRCALVGLLQSQANLALTEMAGMCGYDFLIIDCEHGLFNDRDVVSSLQVLAGVEALGLIRLPAHDSSAIGRYLDMGADGIIVPNVATPEQARALARAMLYPPDGTRGFGAPLHRGTRYGLDLTDPVRSPRAGACLLPIIESELGVANAAEILAVDGVDGVIIGPSDLSAACGRLGDFAHSAYDQAFARIEQAAVRSGKLLGTAPHPGYQIEALLARGHRLFIVGSDIALIRQALSAQVEEANAVLTKGLL